MEHDRTAIPSTWNRRSTPCCGDWLCVEARVPVGCRTLQQSVGNHGEPGRVDDRADDLLRHRVVREAVGGGKVRVLVHYQAVEVGDRRLRDANVFCHRQAMVLKDLGVDVKSRRRLLALTD